MSRLAGWNEARRRGEALPEEPEIAAAARRLAVYGSLAPGESNGGILKGLAGQWRKGFVRGYLEDRGWGARLGYPAMRWDPEGDRIDVKLFVSDDLPAHWGRLDRFEGSGYCRILVPVEDDAGGILLANLYEARR